MSRIKINTYSIEVDLRVNLVLESFINHTISIHGVQIYIIYTDFNSYLELYRIIKDNSSIIYNKQMAVKLIEKFLLYPYNYSNSTSQLYK